MTFQQIIALGRENQHQSPLSLPAKRLVNGIQRKQRNCIMDDEMDQIRSRKIAVPP